MKHLNWLQRLKNICVGFKKLCPRQTWRGLNHSLTKCSRQWNKLWTSLNKWWNRGCIVMERENCEQKKKADSVNMEPKTWSATWHSLKLCTCTLTNGALLCASLAFSDSHSHFYSAESLSPAPRPHSGRRFSGRLFISPPFFCIACRMCVNLCPPLGEWNNEVDLFCSTAPSFGDDTVRCWRHLVHLKGMWKTTFPSSFCPPCCVEKTSAHQQLTGFLMFRANLIFSLKQTLESASLWNVTHGEMLQAESGKQGYF